MLDEAHMILQVDLLERAVSMNRETLITALLELNPAVLHSRTPPKSGAILHAFDSANTHLIRHLTRIWPLPDDLPHAAGAGDFVRVKRWFDATGNPVLGDPNKHHRPDFSLRGVPPAQQVLDTAFAWACLNHRFEIAAFLLEHGANINATWNTHEPASILHLAAMNGDYDLAKFLIDRGIDMTIRDYRWGGTAEGWAYHVGKDRRMHEFLATAQQERARTNDNRADEPPPE